MTIDMTTGSDGLSAEAVEQLRGRVRGALILPGDKDWLVSLIGSRKARATGDEIEPCMRPIDRPRPPRSGRTGNGARINAGLLVALVPAIVALALGAAPANAATPFALDSNPQAEAPQVAVDDGGTAHVVWNERGQPSGGPDRITHYCKVPRGKRACTRREVLRLPSADGFVAQPRVLALSDDRVVVVSGGCCASDAVFAWISKDGGQSFGAPQKIATPLKSYGGDVVPGPGPFAISMLSGVEGEALFRAAPLTGGPITGGAKLAFPTELTIGSGIGFVDPLTPIVAINTNDGRVYFRRFSGGTRYNEEGSWGPATLVADTDENTDHRLASLPSGRKGVHLLTREGGFVHRRFDGQRFANPTRVSAPENTQRLQDFFVDPNGRLHALWTGADGLRYRTSPDGVRWGSPETLLTGYAGGAFSFLADAGCDGGGLGVFVTPDGIGALQFGPTGAIDCEAARDSGCIDSVKVGKNVVVEAQEGCFTRGGARAAATRPDKRNTFTSRGAVRVNGIDLSSAAASPARVIVNTKDRWLKTTRKVEARVGNVLLGRQELAWALPKGTGEIKELAGRFKGQPAKLDTAKIGSDLFGLDVSGFVVPKITGPGEGALTPNVKLPGPFTGMLGGPATAAAPLSFDNLSGLKLAGQKLAIKDASIGIAKLLPFKLSFDAETSALTGTGKLKLPGAGGVDMAFGLRDGDFDFGRAKFTPPAPGIPIAPKAFLTRIDFDITAGRGCQRPTTIGVGGRIVVIPAVTADLALLDLDPLRASYSLPISTCGQPGVFQLTANGKLIGTPVASVKATYKTSGQFTFDAGFNLGTKTAGASVDLNAGVDLDDAAFFARAKARVHVADVTPAWVNAIVSSRGIGACAGLPPAQGGFRYFWGGNLSVDWPPACTLDYDVLIPASLRPAGKASAAQAAARSAGFAVPRGDRRVIVQVEGKASAPGFILTGPGLRIEYPGGDAGRVSTKAYDIFSVPGAKLTKVLLKRPRKGNYEVADAVGADEIDAVARAIELPKPKVRGSVRGRGGKRVLRYRARSIEGQRLTFVEEGRGGVKSVIGRSSKPRGRLSFRPAPGPGGKRRVLAIVEQRGTPRAQVGVASYRAPNAQRPGKVRKLRLKRNGRKLRVSWRRAARANRYAVAWKLADGRRGAKVVRKRRLVIKNVPGIDAGTIRVAGLRADNVAGRVTTAKLKPKPTKQRKKKRRR